MYSIWAINYWQILKLKDPKTDSLATSARRAPRIAAALLCWTGLSAFKVCSACWPDMAPELESPKYKCGKNRLDRWIVMKIARSSNAALDANFRPPLGIFVYTLQVGVCILIDTPTSFLSLNKRYISFSLRYAQKRNTGGVVDPIITVQIYHIVWKPWWPMEL